MSHRIDTQADIAAGLDALLAADPRLAAMAAIAGPLPLRRRPGGFAGLAGIVVSQQLSTASAAAIWGRLAAAYDPFTPQALIRARADRLARLGLSAPKIPRPQGDRAGDAQRCARLRCAPRHAGRCRPPGAVRSARDRAMDGRCLSAVLPRPSGCLAGRRSRFAGSRADRLQPAGPPLHQGDRPARRTVAAVARGGGAALVGLLSRRQTAGRRSGAARPTRDIHIHASTEA